MLCPEVDTLALALSSLMCQDEFLKESAGLNALVLSYIPNLLDVNHLFGDCCTKDSLIRIFDSNSTSYIGIELN